MRGDEVVLLSIDGVPLPTPTKYDFEFSDLDTEKTGRDLNYFMIRHRKRADVYSFPLSWENIGLDDLRTIFNATSPEMFEATFFDVVSGEFITKTMYAGNRKVKTSIIEGDLSDVVCSISFNLIEK